MCLLRCGILHRMARTNRQAAKTHAAQQAAHTALGKLDAKPRLDHPRQVDPPPAHHAMLGKIGPLLHQLSQFRLLPRGQARDRARRLAVT